MRGLVALVIALAGASVVQAKPARRQDFEMLEDAPPPRPCQRAKTWLLVKKCLDKLGTIDVVYQTDAAKVFMFQFKGAAPDAMKRLMLYAQSATDWRAAGLEETVAPTTEVLQVSAFATPTGDGLRVDMGYSARTSFNLDTLGDVKGVLRRTFSTVCVPGEWTCRQLMTACEAYVNGKAYWSFHGDVVWHPSLGLRLRGVTTATGGLCKPSPAQLVNDDETE